MCPSRQVYGELEMLKRQLAALTGFDTDLDALEQRMADIDEGERPLFPPSLSKCSPGAQQNRHEERTCAAMALDRTRHALAPIAHRQVPRYMPHAWHGRRALGTSMPTVAPAMYSPRQAPSRARPPAQRVAAATATLRLSATLAGRSSGSARSFPLCAAPPPACRGGVAA